MTDDPNPVPKTGSATFKAALSSPAGATGKSCAKPFARDCGQIEARDGITSKLCGSGTDRGIQSKAQHAL